MEWPDDPESDEAGIRQIPHALRQLRVLNLPDERRGYAGGAPEERRIVHPGTSPDDARILFTCRQAEWKNGRRIGCKLLVELRVVTIEDPFSDVAVHIVQSPG